MLGCTEIMNCNGSKKPYTSRILYWAGQNWYGVVDGSTLKTERNLKKVKGRCPLYYVERLLNKFLNNPETRKSGRKNLNKNI